MTFLGLRTAGVCMVTRDLRGQFKDEPRHAEILALLGR
jgi:hypothetical protein